VFVHWRWGFGATFYHVQQTVRSFVQAFEATPYEVRATSIITSVYALALEFEATSYHVQQLYNTLYKSFIATSYPVSHKLYNTLHRAVDAALCSHEFTFEVMNQHDMSRS